MATGCGIMEVANEGENVDSEVELNLELCIGRGYKRSKSENDKSRSLCEYYGAGVSEVGGGGVEFNRKREIQALRRREAKKKREEKMKKVANRGSCFMEKKKPSWTPRVAVNVIRFEEKASDARRDMNDDGTDNGSAGCSSSAVSDYQTSPAPQQGSAGSGSSSDSARSNSSYSMKAKQSLTTSASMQYSEEATSFSSSSPSTNSCKPQTENRKEILSLPQMRMPCVSATGNGPNGKTINGLLYRYSKTEVVIVCVCHGSSFSPAGFVEHAGGVNIANPLKHINVVPSVFGL